MGGVSIPRLRRVRFKGGRTITVIHRKPDTAVSDLFKKSVAHVTESQTGQGMQAFALLVWDSRGYCFVDYQIGEASPIAAVSIPQLAKDTLLAETAARWANE